ncbi:MAG: hypothetical protein NZ926_00880 [Candidatus Methanomethylicia archaeon]|nr:hypothetical protein [Candidatus Methanomethylicia archaeon]MCX8168985.1 hypothetical protein [Candidatus Methanomethylicia archaeon]MDW7988717.1 hypothetical protein [Nitrososphaerota archaeon]
MASSAINVFPDAVGIAAIIFSPLSKPLFIACTCGGYKSTIPSLFNTFLIDSGIGNSHIFNILTP